MANSHQLSTLWIAVVLVPVAFFVANGQLSKDFYGKTCPQLEKIVQTSMAKAVKQNRRAAASVLRIFFHDCFVTGCDASILLDKGEKEADVNLGLTSFGVIDTIKADVEEECKGIVSCADILALAALEGVVAVGGPRWSLGLGRRDAKSSSKSDVDGQLPDENSGLAALKSNFAAKGLSAKDMTALSGAHTIGLAKCITFRTRIYEDTNIDKSFAESRQEKCPQTQGQGNGNTAPLDLKTSGSFDNNYFKNLMNQKGLLHSDQELFKGGSQDSLVKRYSTNQKAFFADFKVAMTKMSNINPLTGSSGEIRSNCRS